MAEVSVEKRAKAKVLEAIDTARQGQRSRENSLLITKLQEAAYWAQEDLYEKVGPVPEAEAPP